MNANNESSNIRIFTHPKMRTLLIKMWDFYYGNNIKDVLSALMIDANVDDLNKQNIDSFLKSLSLSDSLIILKDLLENNEVKKDRNSNWNSYGDYIREWHPTLINYLKGFGIEYDEKSAEFYIHEKKMNLYPSVKYIQTPHEQNVIGKESIIIENSNIDGKKWKQNDIFIVHGHDEGMKESVARLIHKLGLNPIILHEQPNMGKTIIEKFEKHSENVICAIVLLSPDDVGYKVGSSESAKSRARQNVILELGYFIGRLGREKVFVLVKSPNELEMPSDILAFVYIEYANGWQVQLCKEMRECGLGIDMNKLL